MGIWMVASEIVKRLRTVYLKKLNRSLDMWGLVGKKSKDVVDPEN